MIGKKSSGIKNLIIFAVILLIIALIVNTVIPDDYFVVLLISGLALLYAAYKILCPYDLIVCRICGKQFYAKLGESSVCPYCNDTRIHC